MTTVKELIEYLKTIPEDTEVEVLKQYDGYYSSHSWFEPLDLKFGVYYSRGSANCKPYLQLGEK